MIKKIIRSIFNKSNCLNKFYYNLSEIKEVLSTWIPLQKRSRKDKKLCFLVLTPEHRNLGDHAIALAEITMLEEMGVDYVEIDIPMLVKMKNHHMMGFLNKKKVLICGGGNLGTLWFKTEELIRCIIENTHNSDVILLPSTIYYEDSDFGKAEFENSKQIYNANKNLTLYAREKSSYEIMKSAYNNVKLIPDMVLSLNKSSTTSTRSGCLLCLRNDCEKTMSDETERTILKQAGLLFGDNVRATDMCIDHTVSPGTRNYELNEKFSQFRSAELVITDRLHGMIFCSITGTPCILVGSKSPKIKGSYEWVKSLEYIHFADDVCDIKTIYENMPKKAFTYDTSLLKPYYDCLREDIKNLFF